MWGIGGGISLINGAFNVAGQSALGGGYWIVVNRDTGIVDSAADGKLTPQKGTNLHTIVAYKPICAIGTDAAESTSLTFNGRRIDLNENDLLATGSTVWDDTDIVHVVLNAPESENAV